MSVGIKRRITKQTRGHKLAVQNNSNNKFSLCVCNI